MTKKKRIKRLEEVVEELADAVNMRVWLPKFDDYEVRAKKGNPQENEHKLKNLTEEVRNIDESTIKFTQATLIKSVSRSNQFSLSEVIYAILDHLGIQLERKKARERVFAKKK